MQPVLKFRLLSARAFPPRRAYEGSVGTDLLACEDVIIGAGGAMPVHTDVAIKLPKNCYGRVAPRSGLTVKHWLNVGAGVIDPDFTGEITILVFNHSPVDYVVRRGSAIAQLICERAEFPRVVQDATLYLGNGRRSLWTRAFDWLVRMFGRGAWTRARAWFSAWIQPAGEPRGARRFGSSDRAR